MALTDAFPGASGTVDTVKLRKNIGGLVVRDQNGQARTGILPRATSNLIVTARASMGVDIAPYESVVNKANGPVLQINDATVTVALPAAPASNSRIDVVYARQNESAAPYTDADNLPTFGVVSSPVAATPDLAAAWALIPSGSLPLASILVPSTATTTQSAGVVITQQYQYTATAGGIVLLRTATSRANFLAGPWQRALQIDTGVEWVYVPASTLDPGGALVAGWYPGSHGAEQLRYAATAFDMSVEATIQWSTSPDRNTLPDLTYSTGVFTASRPMRLRVTPYLTAQFAATYVNVIIRKNSTEVFRINGGARTDAYMATTRTVELNMATNDTLDIRAKSGAVCGFATTDGPGAVTQLLIEEVNWPR